MKYGSRKIFKETRVSVQFGHEPHAILDHIWTAIAKGKFGEIRDTPREN